MIVMTHHAPDRFQSTLPMRGETLTVKAHRDTICDFNPLSPCGERHNKKRINVLIYDFNPLSPCGERPYEKANQCFNIRFQSTLPMRGETRATSAGTIRMPNFNPLSPCGERLQAMQPVIEPIIFQSTLPMRGETRRGR